MSTTTVTDKPQTEIEAVKARLAKLEDRANPPPPTPQQISDEFDRDKRLFAAGELPGQTCFYREYKRVNVAELKDILETPGRVKTKSVHWEIRGGGMRVLCGDTESLLAYDRGEIRAHGD